MTVLFIPSNSILAEGISSWNDLQTALNNGGEITLTQDITAGSDDVPLVVPADKEVTLDLAGCTIDRGLSGSEAVENGNVITVDGKLTLEDSGDGGIITGGNNKADFSGGGIIVHGNLNLINGTITNNTGFWGGGVFIDSNGTFTMSGGEISKNTGGNVFSEGGIFTMIDGTISGSPDIRDSGVIINDNGFFNMYGGIICNNHASSDGGGVIVNIGTFNMSGGTISENTSGPNANAGGVFLFGSTFNMSGGKIINNSSSYGGAVEVFGYSTFNMTGGEISGNTAICDGSGLGGGISVDHGTFNLSEGKIKNNSANWGGGIFVQGGGYSFLNITGENAEISENTAYENGGGILSSGSIKILEGQITKNTALLNGGGIYTAGDLDISGGKVNGNIAFENGGGIFVYSIVGTVFISKDIEIKDNIKIISESSNLLQNVFLNNDNYYNRSNIIYISNSLINEKSIGITHPEGTGTFGYSYGGSKTINDNAKCFFSDNEKYSVGSDDNNRLILGYSVILNNGSSISKGKVTTNRSLSVYVPKEQVTLSVFPDDGYALSKDYLRAVNIETGEEISLTHIEAKSTESIYTFEMPESDVLVSAAFEPVIYTITWKNDDGSIIDTSKYLYNEIPAHDNPGKESTEQYTYEFSGWVPEITEVKDNTTYTAKYSAIINQYAVTFVDDDGTVLKEAVKYDYGTAADDIAKPENPTKEPDDGYFYTFDSWVPEIMDVTKNITYTASYITEKAYYVTVTNDGHGTASAQPEFGKAGTDVTLIYEADSGYQFKKWEVISGDVEIENNQFSIGTSDVEIKVCFEQEKEEKPRILPFFLLEGELPRTGITGNITSIGKNKPASINYSNTDLELFVPDVITETSIVSIEPIDNIYPVEWLGNQCAHLGETDLPGQGQSVIVAHNTLNSEEFGPFAMLSTLKIGDRIFIRSNHGDLMIFQVYANEKINAHDVDSLYKTSSVFENTLTLLTCEDEMISGGYVSRRIVSAKKIN